MVAPQGPKALVTAFLAAISARDYSSFESFFTPNATYWTSGNPAHVQQAGTTSAAEHLPLMQGLLEKFDTYSYDVINIVGELGNIMVETQAVGKGPGDLVYVNNITSTFQVGKESHLIESVREYPEHVEIEWLLKWFQEHS